MKQHYQITFEIDPDRSDRINGLKVYINDRSSDITVKQLASLFDRAAKAEPEDEDNSCGIIVAGSREDRHNVSMNTVFSALDTVMASIPASKNSSTVLITGGLMGPVQMIKDFCCINGLEHTNVVLPKNLLSFEADGLCGLYMLDELKNFKHKKVLVIWDESSKEVPLLFEPTLGIGISLHVYSTKRNRWLNKEDLQDTINLYKDKVQQCLERKS